MENDNEYEQHQPKVYADKAQVFRDLTRLCERLYPLVERFPNSYKNMLGYELLNNAVKSLSYVKEAFDRENDKKEYIKDAKITFNLVVILLRLAHTFKCISHSQHSSLFKDIVNIDGQLKKWLNKQQ